jgi:N-methylhydantoinase A/oxoprolinase/acetone carboxylase beta subunit
MTAFVENSLAAGVQNFAISAAFSPVFEGIEQQVADLILQRNPEAGITCSHELGGLGLVERENAAILNAALLPLAKQVTEAFADAAASLDLGCPVFISQNDGTLMSLERARRFPALTFASGPTNSIRGAAHLTGLEDALVVDIGGTTSDIGVLHQGFPRLANHVVMLGGVRTNFRMPDINAIGIGGGSVVSDDGSEIGPASVGHQLLQRALVAGGDTLTATDIAVAAGQSIFGDPALVSELPRALVDRVQSNISERLSRAVEAMKPGAQRLPVVLVGGGAVLVTADKMAGGDVLRPLHAGVANAIGASIAEVSGEAQAFLTDASQTRESLLADLEQQATAQAITAGGDPSTVRVLEREQSAIPYMEQGNLKLRVKVVASLALLTGADA